MKAGRDILLAAGDRYPFRREGEVIPEVSPGGSDDVCVYLGLLRKECQVKINRGARDPAGGSSVRRRPSGASDLRRRT